VLDLAMVFLRFPGLHFTLFPFHQSQPTSLPEDGCVMYCFSADDGFGERVDIIDTAQATHLQEAPIEIKVLGDKAVILAALCRFGARPILKWQVEFIPSNHVPTC
jgi:hypothetical protein